MLDWRIKLLVAITLKIKELLVIFASVYLAGCLKWRKNNLYNNKTEQIGCRGFWMVKLDTYQWTFLIQIKDTDLWSLWRIIGTVFENLSISNSKCNWRAQFFLSCILETQIRQQFLFSLYVSALALLRSKVL